MFQKCVYTKAAGNRSNGKQHVIGVCDIVKYLDLIYIYKFLTFGTAIVIYHISSEANFYENCDKKSNNPAMLLESFQFYIYSIFLQILSVERSFNFEL